MNRIINYKIDEANAGKSINEYLRERYYPAKMLTQFRHSEGSVQVNGLAVYMKTLLKDGEELTINYTENDQSDNILPVKLSFGIVYEDEDIMIVDKPADMPVHPAINNFDNTLANGISYYYQSKGQGFCFRCINRLDRNTSGLLIIAKHRLAAGILSDFLISKKIHREYLALASGSFEERKATISLPIGRISDSIIERKVDFENGQEAITHYEVLEEGVRYDVPCSLLRIRLDTGRTHQIRVHMSHMGHPLVGDHMYNPAPGSLDRQALHSHRLVFPHPISLEQLCFISDTPW